MLQQILALIVVVFMLARLLWQRSKKQVSSGEFVFWLIFWVLVGIAVVTLKWIDEFVRDLGFSGSGIEFLLYVAVVLLFYLVFKVRLRLERIEKQITKLVRSIALKDSEGKR